MLVLNNLRNFWKFLKKLGENMKNFKIILLLILAFFVFYSCPSDPDKYDYVSIYIINGTLEPIKVYTGETSFLFGDSYITIRRDEERSVSVVKGATVRAVGVETGKTYSSRTFSFNTTWIL
jgi:hypothetical protein